MFFDMFHILLPGDSLRDLWNVYMYACMYVIPLNLMCDFIWNLSKKTTSIRSNS